MIFWFFLSLSCIYRREEINCRAGILLRSTKIEEQDLESKGIKNCTFHDSTELPIMLL